MTWLQTPVVSPQDSLPYLGQRMACVCCGNLSWLCNGGGCCRLRFSCFCCSTIIAEPELKWIYSGGKQCPYSEIGWMTPYSVWASHVNWSGIIPEWYCPRKRLLLTVLTGVKGYCFSQWQTQDLGKGGLQKSESSHGCNPGHNRLSYTSRMMYSAQSTKKSVYAHLKFRKLSSTLIKVFQFLLCKKKW